MKILLKNKTLRGFMIGFMVCAILCTGGVYADDIYENISVILGKMNIYLGDTKIDIDNLVYNGRTYVPLRDFSSYMNKVVTYDEATQSVIIREKGEAQSMSKEVAFLVNGRPVRVDFFSQMINWYKLNAGGFIPTGDGYNDFKDFVRGEVVAMEITNQYAQELGVTLFADELKQIDQTAQTYAEKYGGMDAFKQLLSQNGVSYDVYYEIQKNYALRSKLSDIMTDEITVYDLIDYYHENIESYKVEKVKAKHIFLSMTDDSGYLLSNNLRAQKENKLQGIYNKIKSGEADFDEMMFLYSEDAGLKAYPDGYVFGRGEMVTAVENMAFSMEKGEMSEVFESELGYHILYVEDRLVTYEDFEKVRESIFNSLRNEAYYKVVEPRISRAYVYINHDVYNNI